MAQNYLQQELDSNGISQTDLSKESKVSVGTINKICNQNKTPAPKTCAKIVIGLNGLSKKKYVLNDIFL
ncbi:hypothetical protein MNB_SUP05-SYMBIONT-4-276 [hydrothermal vent metagenome]|uniref:HTH cro/C1-type domain-containing protein n=1 Tax=hydrothermal vent metagenome TaxID=652676 RepID=A0A1W1DYU2_9ZZZZ